ncbi:MAG: hypothetical protein IJB80_05205 [Clostridia bacterium]|nr:hypothetical protein [Clostridia bacterium]
MGKGYSGYYNNTTKGNQLDAILLSSRSNAFTRRKDKRHGNENRQPQGSRERNVGHPNGEEHSRTPKGNRGPRIRRSEIMKNVGKGLVVTDGTAAAGYLIYRGIRMLPSLIPGLWWTIPANIATP